MGRTALCLRILFAIACYAAGLAAFRISIGIALALHDVLVAVLGRP